MTEQTIRSILGYRDEHPLGCEVDSGRAGALHHNAGIGHIRVGLIDGEEIYIKGEDLAEFARLYRSLGRDAIAKVDQQILTGKRADEMGLAVDPEQILDQADQFLRDNNDSVAALQRHMGLNYTKAAQLKEAVEQRRKEAELRVGESIDIQLGQ